MCAKRNRRKDLFDEILFLNAEGETIHEKRRAAYDKKMSGQYGNILARCPACGRLSLVPNTGRKRWKCPCTPKQSRFVQEDALPDQKHLTLERGVTAFAGREYPVLSDCRQLEQVTIKGYDKIAEGAFDGCSHLRAVRLLDGITRIGCYAFRCCTALERIDLPGSLTGIDDDAFSGCTALERIGLPSGLIEIGDRAFADCTALKEIDLPSSLTEIGDHAFSGCTALKQIGLPGSLTRIGNYAFFCCTALQEIILPGGLTRIGDSAFEYCPALEKIDLPEGLAGIGACAFEYSGLREIVLPDRLQQVGEGAFAQCMHLEKVEIPEKLLVGLQLYDVFYHTPFYKNNYEGVWKFLPDGTVEMRASLREFVHLAGRWPQPIFLHCAGSLFCEGDPAFFEPAGPKERKQMEESLQKIVTLELYGSSVPAWQFCGCSNLKRLILNSGLERIGEEAFAHCTALEELVIPEDVTFIGPKAFLGCSSLRHVRMEEPLLKTLDGSAFERTPFWQSPILRRQARRRSDALLVFLGHAAGNTAAALCKRMNCRQDMLLLGSAVGPLRIHAHDCAQAVLCAPVPVPQKPRIYAIQLGKTFLNGRSAGGCPEWGIQALREAKDEVCALLRQYQRVIVVTNPAGGTSSSVTLLAQWLRKMGISHTIIAGTPFAFEGRRRMEVAQNALNELRGSPLIEVPYEEIMQRAENEEIKVTLKNVFDWADKEVCRRLEQLLAKNGLQ